MKLFGRAGLRQAVLWFAASLLLRSLVLFALVEPNTRLIFDESEYLQSATGYEQIYRSALNLERPPQEALELAYWRGYWPPLHAMSIGAMLLVFDSKVTAARFLQVLFSALTTLVVFLLADRIAGRRTAHCAAGLHLLYPSFVAYSHLLWAETLAGLLVSLAMLPLVWSRVGDRGSSGWVPVVSTGIVLGALLLTRVNMVPLVFLFVALAAWRTTGGARRRIAAGFVMLAIIFGMTGPWLWALSQKEGEFLLLSRLGGYNLALGNNPWVPGAYGSSWGHETSKRELHAQMERLSQEQGTSWAAAAGPIARAELSSQPLRFSARALARVRMLWAPDFFALRHLLNANYPLVSPGPGRWLPF